MIDREKVIEKLESLRDICNAKSDMAVGNGKIAWCGYANAADDALTLLKKQEAKRGRWVFNDKKGLFDCANCGISSHYQYNSHCGAIMTDGGEANV